MKAPGVLLPQDAGCLRYLLCRAIVNLGQRCRCHADTSSQCDSMRTFVYLTAPLWHSAGQNSTTCTVTEVFQPDRGAAAAAEIIVSQQLPRRVPSQHDKYRQSLAATKRLTSLLSGVPTREFEHVLHAVEMISDILTKGGHFVVVELEDQAEDATSLRKLNLVKSLLLLFVMLFINVMLFTNFTFQKIVCSYLRHLH